METDNQRQTRRVAGQVAKVRDHPVWRKEAKPWGDWPFKALHKSIETHYLYRTPLHMGPGNYANLGVYHGASTYAMARGVESHGGHVHGVDIFKRTISTPIVMGKEALDAEFKERGLDRFVTLHHASTQEAAKKLRDMRFKLIFIDADHAYKSVCEDIRDWSPLLEEGGLLSFHDTFMDRVQRAIADELGDDWEMVDHVYTIKTYRRK